MNTILTIGNKSEIREMYLDFHKVSDARADLTLSVNGGTESIVCHVRLRPTTNKLYLDRDHSYGISGEYIEKDNDGYIRTE